MLLLLLKAFHMPQITPILDIFPTSWIISMNVMDAVSTDTIYCLRFHQSLLLSVLMQVCQDSSEQYPLVSIP